MTRGFEQSEEFPTLVTARQELIRQTPSWIVLYALFAIFIGVISAFGGSPSIPLAIGGGLFALVLVLVLVAALTSGRLRKTHLVVGPEGLRRADHVAVVTIPWADAVRIDRIATVDRPLEWGVVNRLLTIATNPLERRSTESVIGSGTLVPAQTALAGAVRAVEDHHRRLGQGPDGRQLRAIALPEFDPGWREGRIGDWIRAHRPDLLA